MHSNEPIMKVKEKNIRHQLKTVSIALKKRFYNNIIDGNLPILFLLIWCKHWPLSTVPHALFRQCFGSTEGNLCIIVSNPTTGAYDDKGAMYLTSVQTENKGHKNQFHSSAWSICNHINTDHTSNNSFRFWPGPFFCLVCTIKVILSRVKQKWNQKKKIKRIPSLPSRTEIQKLTFWLLLMAREIDDGLKSRNQFIYLWNCSARSKWKEFQRGRQREEVITTTAAEKKKNDTKKVH